MIEYEFVVGECKALCDCYIKKVGRKKYMLMSRVITEGKSAVSRQNKEM